MTKALQIADFEDSNYNPFTAYATLGGEERVVDLHPELERLRRLSPVWELDMCRHFNAAQDMTTAHLRHFSILGFDEVTQVLGQPALYSNQIYNLNLGVYFGKSVTTMDRPDHTGLRPLFQKAFTPSSISEWGTTTLPRIINRLIDSFDRRGSADLAAEFALKFPFHFIHELLSLPAEDRDTFQKLAFGQITIGFDPLHAHEAIRKIRDYLSALVHERCRRPVGRSDLIHILATAEIGGVRLPHDVVVAFFRQLMYAGGDTSYHSFSTLMAALLTHPEQLDAVKRDRQLVPQAVEEGLRWDPAVFMISRTPIETVSIGGVKINPGDEIQVVLGAASRDEGQYSDPHSFNIFRERKRHHAFGFGPHVCIGQHLARMEMTIALNALLDRLPALRLADAWPRPAVSGLHMRGAKAVHVRFD